MDAMMLTVNRRRGKLWAVLQFPLTRFLLAFIAIFLWVGAAQFGFRRAGVAPQSPLGALVVLLLAIGVLIIYVLYVRFLERRPLVELAAAGAQRHASRGILVGAGLFCATMLVLKLLGVWSYTGVAPLSALAYPLIGAVFAGILEETVVRGLLFRIMEESLGSWIAL